MRLRAWSLTDVGRRRDQNEDSVLDDPRHGLFAVADGMGGHVGGAFASKLALKVLHREVRRALPDLDGAIERLREQAARRSRRTRGETARLAAIDPEASDAAEGTV